MQQTAHSAPHSPWTARRDVLQEHTGTCCSNHSAWNVSQWHPLAALEGLTGLSFSEGSSLPHTKVWYFIKVFMGIVSWAKQQLLLCPLKAAPSFSPLHFTWQDTKPGKTQPSSKPVDQQHPESAADSHCRMLPLCCPSSSSFSLMENPTAMKRKSFVSKGPHSTSTPGKNDDTLLF